MTGSRLALRILWVALAALGASGCSNVAAHQRGRLAHFTMQARDGSSAGRAHIHAIHEGAIGGEVEFASGCGCN